MESMLGLGRAYRAEKGGKMMAMWLYTCMFIFHTYTYIYYVYTEYVSTEMKYHLEFMKIYVISRFRLSFSRCAHAVNEID